MPGTTIRERSFFRVASWNIEWYPAGQRGGQEQATNWQTAAVAHLINQIKPDVLATQEIRNIGALQRLNRNIGLWPFSHLAASIFYQKNDTARDLDRIQQQCGFMARHPWDDLWEVDFTPIAGADRPVRGWLAARWKVGPLTFTIYNGHLKSDSGAGRPEERAANYRNRRAAIAELKADLDRHDLDPYRDKILVLGNFNTDYFLADAEGAKIFTDLDRLGFHMAQPPVKREEAITLPARKGVEEIPDQVVDYIFLSSGWRGIEPELKILAQGASKKKDVFGGDAPGLASDHYPVYIDIPLGPENPR
ncbi:MAG: endonuclease/exonuclease/phosphatase family protein [Candidatus Methylacidiphilales bacterium]|nr:endonuclease/exonuclease/phosphatase family protein [Candidatus Methylacidiphilales bacterium]